MLKFALAGNPNSGKTTLFNSLTGSTAHVGNWPGVTVDKKEGLYKKLKEQISIIDLPGIYSLSPYTPEEVISRNFILEEKPDCIINIVDATNLERNLYLSTQLLEIDVPIVIALNMMDAVTKSGDSIDAKKLQEKIGVPVVEISALKEENIDQLMKVAFEAAKSGRKGATVLEKSSLTHLINDVEIAFKAAKIANPLFHAIKLIEKDEIECEKHNDLLSIVDDFKSHFNDEIFGNDLEAVIADARYKYISSNFTSVLSKKTTKDKNKMENVTKSDKIDRVLSNKWAGIPLF
ncbi:MAG: FeoB small GTPase domain-containing protein, partial [Erysipelotrichales bacterium]|nr:FeoB small GTPase domain-containing protein [Erysipelotrichales bacterium]